MPDTETEYIKQSPATTDSIMETAHIIHDLGSRQFACGEEILLIDREIHKLSPWGDFNFNDLKMLKERGIDIRLYELNAVQFSNIPGDIKIFILSRTKTTIRLAAVFTDENNASFPYEHISLPEVSLSQLELQRADKTKEIESIQKELEKLSVHKNNLRYAIAEIDQALEFEHAVSTMSREEKVAYITGYIPENHVDTVKAAASKNGWGLMITDPSGDDPVPTLVENPKFLRAISPVFKLLGTIPGYKEFDISLWFLIFFSFFWALIIGDAGYGILFLILTIIGRIKFKKVSFELFLLLFITSITTIVWGAITGTWFGVEALSKTRALSWMIIPSISSFAGPDSGTDIIIMNICFFVGAIHLSVAHLLNFFRIFPALKSYSEIGKISLIWGLFFLTRNLVLSFELNPFTVWFICAGLILIFIFSEQKGRFFKGILDSSANLLVIALNSISFFSDIVSYVRLFAVGLAALEVAKSFNSMAMSLGSGVFAVIGSVLILFIGHGLNITLSAMSLIVHGVRLNMLEFSGHLNMEWSGYTYKPFKKVL
ncbi:MAG: V-type ATP synthase subunit I [Spirochaetes bacterium]|nr:V-type ATP synthase subunit I [Spirochaetota bacterium]